MRAWFRGWLGGPVWRQELLLFVAPGFSAWLFGMSDQVGLMRYLGGRDIFIGGRFCWGVGWRSGCWRGRSPIRRM
ncbi:MAG: hypothetical protein U0232_04560 [Thermomicrobiales bacterium]